MPYMLQPFKKNVWGVILGDADFLCVEGQYFHEIGVHEIKKKSKWSQL